MQFVRLTYNTGGVMAERWLTHRDLLEYVRGYFSISGDARDMTVAIDVVASKMWRAFIGFNEDVAGISGVKLRLRIRDGQLAASSVRALAQDHLAVLHWEPEGKFPFITILHYVVDSVSRS